MLADKNILRRVADFFYWKISWMLLILFMLLSAYCIFVWYGYVYSPGWSEDRKQEYIQSKGSDEVFNKTGLDGIFDEKKRRGADSQKTFENVADLFKLEGRE